MHCRTTMLLALAVVTLGATLGVSTAGADDWRERRHGALFVMTNSADRVQGRGNEIVMYDRNAAGDLKLVGYFPTGQLSEGEPQFGSGPAPTAQVFTRGSWASACSGVSRRLWLVEFADSE